MSAIRLESKQIVFKVEDTGVGIERDELDTLFSLFTKINSNRNLNKQGCGLGLMISKKLAEALGGDIVVDSVKGRGSTFSLIINEMDKDNL
jgi:signal transduction histidine kinase